MCQTEASRTPEAGQIAQLYCHAVLGSAPVPHVPQPATSTVVSIEMVISSTVSVTSSARNPGVPEALSQPDTFTHGKGSPLLAS